MNLLGISIGLEIFRVTMSPAFCNIRMASDNGFSLVDVPLMASKLSPTRTAPVLESHRNQITCQQNENSSDTWYHIKHFNICVLNVAYHHRNIVQQADISFKILLTLHYILMPRWVSMSKLKCIIIKQLNQFAVAKYNSIVVIDHLLPHLSASPPSISPEMTIWSLASSVPDIVTPSWPPCLCSSTV